MSLVYIILIALAHYNTQYVGRHVTRIHYSDSTSSLQQQYVGRHVTRIHYSDSTSSLQQQYVGRHVTRIHYSDSTSSLQQQYVGRHPLVYIILIALAHYNNSM